MSNINLNNLRDRAYQWACDHGFHDTSLSNDHLLMLVITELSEAVEADRKNKRSDYNCFKAAVNFQSVTTDKIWKDAFEEYIKDTVEDELADAVIRLLDLAGLRKISLVPAQVDIELNSRPLREYYYILTFTEAVYNIILSTIAMRLDLYDTLNMFIPKIFALAESLKIDLAWHIEQKMKYNELRPAMHGKKY